MKVTSPFSSRIRANQTLEIKRARQIRETAVALRSRVSRGFYSDDDLREFWALIKSAGLLLRASNPELSARSGLGSGFFASMASRPRRPKLSNLQKALTGIIETVNERLVDIDEVEAENEIKADWVENPIKNNSMAINRIQEDLYMLIEQLKSSNSLHQIEEIDEHYRKSLISLLETTISILKAPLIERSLIAHTGERLRNLAVKVSDHASAGFIGGLAGAGATALLNLLK